MSVRPSSTYQFKVVPFEQPCTQEHADRIKQLLELAKLATVCEAFGGCYLDPDDGKFRVMLDAGHVPFDRRRESFAFSEIVVERIVSNVLGPR